MLKKFYQVTGPMLELGNLRSFVSCKPGRLSALPCVSSLIFLETETFTGFQSLVKVSTIVTGGISETRRGDRNRKKH